MVCIIVTGDLAAAVRNRTDIHIGLYHSLFEWYNPLYLEDKRNAYKTQDFVKVKVCSKLAIAFVTSVLFFQITFTYDLNNFTLDKSSIANTAI